MSKKDLLIHLIPWTPLIVLINLLPFIISAINPKLLFGIELDLIAVLFLKYRKKLVESSRKTENGHYEMGKRTYDLRIIFGSVAFLGIGSFPLISYVLEVVNR